MNIENDHAVRPTKRCLSDLGLSFPTVNTPLSAIDHPLIGKAQRLPDDVASGGAERIKALTDRVWFKVKVVNLRGAATELLPEDSAQPELLSTAQAWWWLGAAGERKQHERAELGE